MVGSDQRRQQGICGSMKNRLELTEALLREKAHEVLPSPYGKKGEIVIRDGKVQGFLVRIYPKPTPPHTVTFGVQRKMTVRTTEGGPLKSAPIKRVIGSWPTMSVKDARSEAKVLLGRMEAGEDPNVVRKAAKKATAKAHSEEKNTFGALFGQYQSTATGVADSTKKDREKVLKWMSKSPLWKTPATDLTIELLEETFVPLFSSASKQSKPKWWGGETVGLATAWKCYRYCAAAWANYMTRVYGGAPSRSAGIFGAMAKARNWPKIKPRTNHLDIESGAAMGWVKGLLGMRQNIDPVRRTFADYLWCDLVWGGRKREVQLIKWSDLDLEKAYGVFRAENTKGKKDHYFPLTPFTLGILKERKEANIAWGRTEGDYVFPSRQYGKPIYDHRSALETLKEESGLWLTAHDLRRTVATETAHVTENNQALVSLTLAHAQEGATPLYIQQMVTRMRPSFVARENRLLALAGIKQEIVHAPKTLELMELLNKAMSEGDEALEKKIEGLLVLLK